MKICRISYFLLICFLGFYHTSPAAPANRSEKTSQITWVTKSHWDAGRSQCPIDDEVTKEVFTRSSLSVNTPLTPIESSFYSEPWVSRAGTHSVLAIEKVLKSYLLHLFPSHYFW